MQNHNYRRLFLLLFVPVTTVQGLFLKNPGQVDLAKVAPTLYSNRLNYRVAVGNKETPFQMKDMHVELSSNRQTPPRQQKQTTGVHDATLLRQPTFVNENGEQVVELEKGGWELQWTKESPHGFLVCSFVSPVDVQRNDDAKLDAGRFFLYHRVWNTATLASERERRTKIQAEAAKSLDERDQKIKEITDEGNKDNLGKVVSYAKAAKSMNDYRGSGMREAVYIPLHDHQVLKLTPDCIVSSRGLVYKQLENRKSAYIGESRVDFLEKEENDEDQSL